MEVFRGQEAWAGGLDVAEATSTLTLEAHWSLFYFFRQIFFKFWYH